METVAHAQRIVPTMMLQEVAEIYCDLGDNPKAYLYGMIVSDDLPIYIGQIAHDWEILYAEFADSAEHHIKCAILRKTMPFWIVVEPKDVWVVVEASDCYDDTVDTWIGLRDFCHAKAFIVTCDDAPKVVGQPVSGTLRPASFHIPAGYHM